MIVEYKGDTPLIIVTKWHSDPFGGPAIRDTTMVLTNGDKIDLDVIKLVAVKAELNGGGDNE